MTNDMTGQATAQGMRSGRLRRRGRGTALGLGAVLATAGVVSTAAAAPPDRVYERVTPALKESANPVADGGAQPSGWASAGGGTLLYQQGLGAGAPDAPRGIEQFVVANRGASDWSVRSAVNGPKPSAPSPLGGTGLIFPFPSVDASSIVGVSAMAYTEDAPTDPTGYHSAGVWLGRGKAVDWVSRPGWPGSTPAPGAIDREDFLPVGASPDLSTVYFQSRAVLTQAEDAAGRGPRQTWALYRWKNGVLSLAGTLPDGTIPVGGSAAAGSVQTGGLNTGDLEPVQRDVPAVSYTNSVSADGESVLFAARDAGGTAQLYLRRGGDPSVLVSTRNGDTEPVGGSAGVASVGARTLRGLADGDGRRQPVEAVADPDHRTVLFATTDALTTDADILPANVRKVYRYDTASKALRLLPELSFPDADWEDSTQAGPVLRVSDDASQIVFMTPSGDLRLWRDGRPTVDLGGGAAVPGLTAQIEDVRFSPDGATIALTSVAPLNGETRHPAGGSTPEVYVADTRDAAGLSCVSCAAVGDAPVGASALRQISPFSSPNPGAQRETRSFSADSRSLVFSSATRLTPDDQNDNSDVYELRDGVMRLVSPGTAAQGAASADSFLIDMSADGRDVFFSTPVGIAAGDDDDYVDIYNARVGGGFPTVDVPAPCAGDACQGPVVPPAGAPQPTSSATGPPSRGPIDRSPSSNASLAITRSSASATRVSLGIRAPGAGALRVSGSRVKTARRTTTRVAVYTVRAALTTAARRTLKRRGTVAVRVRVRYAPTTGKTVTKSATITVRRRAR